MAQFPGMEDDEDELAAQAPVSTIAGPQTPREQVMQRISQVRGSSADEADRSNLDRSAMQYAQDTSMTANIGRALNALAQGTGFKADNSGYDAMERNANSLANNQLNRSAQVKKAVQARLGREAALKASQEEKALARQDQARRDANTERHQRAMEEIARGKLDGKGVPKQLPPDKVLNVNEGNILPQQLSDIKETLKKNTDAFGPVMGRLSSLNPYDERSSTIDAQMRSAAQAFGRYMEGGVLRKEDEEKYRKMFPNLSDTPEVAKNKLAIVERLLASKQGSNVQALRDSGYDVAGVDKSLGVPEVPGVLSGVGKNGSLIPEAMASTPTFGAEDLEALQWAKANPQDPRAKEIAQRLRSKGLH